MRNLLERFKHAVLGRSRSAPASSASASASASATVSTATPVEFTLDRQVRIDGNEPGRFKLCDVSELRDVPFLVILGEPGIGKSTVLATEARFEGTEPMSVRRFMNLSPRARQDILMLDALDEYRIDGSATDKIYQLNQRVADIAPTRWRLTCRAEDWRRNSDMRAINAAAGEAGIVVAQLMPLRPDEIKTVLTSLGDKDPSTFVREAVTRGAGSLLTNPLSLRLLHTAVSAGGAWPATRYDVFDLSCGVLAYEHNEDRDPQAARAGQREIVSAAETAMLFMLVSGARALWRSPGPPQAGEDERALLPVTDIPIAPTLAGDMLDTPLFIGIADRFEPMHRSIAEFLAGRALAKAVIGNADNAAFPLKRALALIAAPDRKPPTELRGLYAWFAAHLAKLGAPEKARELIETDAVSVLAYGDAGAFDLDTRLDLLGSLDNDDPYFMRFEAGATALGGLASEDMASALRNALGHADGRHLLSTVFEILQSGVPIASLRPDLLGIALDTTRPSWHRTRAASAWLNWSGDPDALRRKLLNLVDAEPSSSARADLRAMLMTGLSETALTDDDIRSLLAETIATDHSPLTFRLYNLRRRLIGRPRTALLDQPLSSWLGRRDGNAYGSIEINNLLDEMAASAIASGQFDGTRIWPWTVNLREDPHDDPDEKVRGAIRRWLDADPRNAIELYDAIVDDPSTASEAPGTANHFFYALTADWPDDVIAEHLIRRSDREADVAVKSRLGGEIVEIVRRGKSSHALFDRTWNWVSHQPGADVLLTRLSTSPLDEYRARHAARERRRRDAASEERARVVQEFLPIVHELRSGRDLVNLDQLAGLSLLATGDALKLSGRERVAASTDDTIADAAMVGFVVAALKPPAVSPREIGEAEARNDYIPGEFARVAGVEILIGGNDPRLDDAPVTLALLVLGSGGLLSDTDERRTVREWAYRVLDRDPGAGADAILEQWEGVVTAGGARSSHWEIANEQRASPAVTIATERLLAAHPDLPSDTLHLVLTGAAGKVPAETLRRLAENALDGQLSGRNRARWSLTLFALVGDTERDRLKGHRSEYLRDLLEAPIIGDLFIELPAANNAILAARDAAVIRILGPVSEPEDSRPRTRLLRPHSASDPVHMALRRLEKNPDPTAGRLMAECIAHPKLSAWRDAIKHANAMHARVLRDSTFAPPAPQRVLAAIAGEGPVNAADLRAIVQDELDRLARETRTGSSNGWMDYWNADKDGKPTNARIENVCRDTTLTKLQQVLKPYGIGVAYPEAARADSTRADVLVATGVGRNLPIEAKRHYHADLWSAAAGQLQGYAAAEGADGNGILLVFWFGRDWAPAPKRADGKIPTGAAELKEFLEEDLPAWLHARTDIVVFDVSRPRGGKSATAYGRASAIKQPALTKGSTSADRSPSKRGGHAKSNKTHGKS